MPHSLTVGCNAVSVQTLFMHETFIFLTALISLSCPRAEKERKGKMSILAFLGKQTNKAAVRRKFTLLPSAEVGGEHVDSSGQCLAAPPLARFSVLLLPRCGSSTPS